MRPGAYTPQLERENHTPQLERGPSRLHAIMSKSRMPQQRSHVPQLRPEAAPRKKENTENK